MASHDMIATIERYPDFDKDGELKGVSFGCPELDLMGYISLEELLVDIYLKLKCHVNRAQM